MRHSSILSLGMALLLPLTTSGAAAAHHSFAMYDRDRTSVLTGTVTSFRWINPHAILSVESIEDGQEPTTWNFELSSPGNLTRTGLNRRSFVTGDEVEVTFNPLRDGQPGGACWSVKVLATDEVFECGAAAAIRAGEQPNLP